MDCGQNAQRFLSPHLASTYHAPQSRETDYLFQCTHIRWGVPSTGAVGCQDEVVYGGIDRGNGSTCEPAGPTVEGRGEPGEHDRSAFTLRPRRTGTRMQHAATERGDGGMGPGLFSGRRAHCHCADIDPRGVRHVWVYVDVGADREVRARLPGGAR